MASKKYKGKTCAYCAVPGISETADHVIAQSFFLPEFREGLPKVPACLACNRAKSELEHYATAVLPFGAKHVEAGRTLAEQVPGRLAKNIPLAQSLFSGLQSRWTSHNFGPFELEGVMPFDAKLLVPLFTYIARGLAFHHWGLICGADFFVAAAYIANEGFQDKLERMLRLHGKETRHAEADLGEGVFTYVGTRILPGLAVWRMSLYGVDVSGADRRPSQRIKESYAIIVHDSMPMAADFRKALSLEKQDDSVIVEEGAPGR